MFSWFKKGSRKSGEDAETHPPKPAPTTEPEPAPESPKGNPARGSEFTVAITGPKGERTDKVDLLKILEGTFRELGREVCLVPGCLVDVASGLEFRPGMVNLKPNNDLSVQTSTTIEIKHPVQFPVPFFEYQHFWGTDTAASIKGGFEAWAKLDLPPLLDAARPALETCSALEMQFPDGRSRRIVLGPVAVMLDPSRKFPDDTGKAGQAKTEKAENTGHAEKQDDDACEAHPAICPCCLFTNCLNAFQPLVASKGPFAIRIYAARQTDGAAQSDCRVNGEDFTPGAEALRAYVPKWPHTGLETRKQYIIIQDRPAAASS